MSNVGMPPRPYARGTSVRANGKAVPGLTAVALQRPARKSTAASRPPRSPSSRSERTPPPTQKSTRPLLVRTQNDLNMSSREPAAARRRHTRRRRTEAEPPPPWPSVSPLPLRITTPEFTTAWPVRIATRSHFNGSSEAPAPAACTERPPPVRPYEQRPEGQGSNDHAGTDGLRDQGRDSRSLSSCLRILPVRRTRSSRRTGCREEP